MLEFHRARKALVTILVHQRVRSNSIIELDSEGRVTRILERPTDAQRQGISSPWVNSGIYLCAPGFLDLITPGIASDLPRDVFPKAIATGHMFAFPLTGYRCAVDSPERLAEVRAANRREEALAHFHALTGPFAARKRVIGLCAQIRFPSVGGYVSIHPANCAGSSCRHCLRRR